MSCVDPLSSGESQHPLNSWCLLLAFFQFLIITIYKSIAWHSKFQITLWSERSFVIAKQIGVSNIHDCTFTPWIVSFILKISWTYSMPFWVSNIWSKPMWSDVNVLIWIAFFDILAEMFTPRKSPRRLCLYADDWLTVHRSVFKSESLVNFDLITFPIIVVAFTLSFKNERINRLNSLATHRLFLISRVAKR